MLIDTKYLKDWLAYLQNNKRYSKNTVLSYEFDIQNFLIYNREHLKLDKIEKLNSMNVRSWISHRRTNQNISARAVSRGFCALKSFLKFLGENKIRVNDEIFDMKNIKFNKSLPRAMELSEIKFSNLLHIDQSDDWLILRDKSIIMLMYGCGLRISEALGIKIFDIDINNMNVKIIGKGSKERIVPIIPYVLKSLLDYFYACPFICPDGARDTKYDLDSAGQVLRELIKTKRMTSLEYIFFIENGSNLTRNNFAIRLKKLLVFYNLPFKTSSHSFRHSFATHLLENHANIKQIQSLLGHSNLSSTEIYTKVSDSALRKMYEINHPRS